MDRVASMTAFTTVVNSGSFAAAAQRLNMSPAMVTNHVRALEERLGARLLNRTTRKLSLTEAGRSYFDQCALILAQIEAADSSVSELQAAPRGTLHLNAATVLSYSVAPLIGAFTAAYPEITIDLTTTDRMVDMVEDGVDLAIRFNQPPDSSLIVRRLGAFRVILCAAPSYLEKHGAPETPGDLSHHNCLAYSHRGYNKLAREWPLTGPGGEVQVPVTGNLQSNSIETLITAAYEGRGIAMLTSCSAIEPLRLGRLVQVLPDWHVGEFPIIALYPHRHHVPARMRAFLDFAANYFSGAVAGCIDGAAPAETVMPRQRTTPQQDNVSPVFSKPRRIAV